MATSVLRTLSLRLTANSAQFRKDIDKVDGKMRKFSNRVTRYNRDMTGSFSTMLAGIGVTAFAGEALRAGDAMTDLRNKMGAAFDSTFEVAQGMTDVKRIARESRAEITSVGTLYQRMAVSTRNLGLEQEDLAKITQVVANTFTISGASTMEAANSARQFAQGMASGALRGDEFRSVAENNVELTRMLADGLGMTIGQLREFAYTGGLTAEKIVPILTAGFEDSVTAINKMDVTVKQASTNFTNRIAIMVDAMNQRFGLLTKFAQGINTLANNFGRLAMVVGLLVVPALTAFVARGIVSVAMASATAVAGLALSFLKLGTVLIMNVIPALAKTALFLARFLVIPLAIGTAITGAIAGLVVAIQRYGGDLVDGFSNLADGLSDYVASSFKRGFLNVKLFFGKMVNYVIGKAKEFGVDLGVDLFPVEQISGQLAGVIGEVDKATDKMGGAFSGLSGSVMSDFQALSESIKDGSALDKLQSIFSGTGDGFNVEMSLSGMMASAGTGLDALMAKLTESFPALKDFFAILNGTYSPDEGVADDREAAAKTPESMAERWIAALTGIKNTWGDLSKSVGQSVGTMMKSYDSWDKVMAKGAMKSKKLAAVRMALMMREALMATKLSVAKSMELGFPAAIPGVALAIAQGAMVMADIRSQAKGQFHDGIDNVPNTGTYLLEQGERVVDKRLNADLKEFLGAGAARNTSAPVTLNVNGVSDPDVVVEALSSRRGELETLIRRITAENVTGNAF